MTSLIDRHSWERTVPWIDRDDVDIDGYVRSLGGECSGDLREKLIEWHRDGIVIFEQCVDKELIHALLDDVKTLVTNPRKYELGVEIRGKQADLNEFSFEELRSPGLKLNSIHSISMAAARLSVTPKVAEFLSHIFKEPCAALQSLTFFKGSQQPVHIDYPYVRTQTEIAKLAASWIPLEDIHPDSGPLEYFPGSHRVDVSDFFDWGDGSIVLEKDSKKTPAEFAPFLRERLALAGIKPKVFCPKVGDVLLWHGNLMHGGTPIRNSSLTRKSYVTHYTSLSAYPDGYRTAGTVADSRCVRDENGYVFEYPWVKGPKLPSWAHALNS